MVSGSKRVARRKAKIKVQETSRAAIATKAIGYLRVSTEEQATHGYGLEAQEKAVRAFAESQGYELVDVVQDPGVSGATRPADRPGFRSILEAASAGRASVLLVYKFDRLAREIRYAVTTVAELGEQHNVVIRSVTEPIDTSTPMGRTLFAILAGMAETEREAITERTKGGRIQKASRGGYAGGGVPYGYARDPATGTLSIVELQAAVVRRIFRARRARPRRTLQTIADELNAEGIPSPTGGTWQTSTLSYLADNAKYRGLVEYLFAETHVLQPGTHEAII